nr:MAG TPA: hypothetical protein [Caudoviricetes sp.]
MFSLSTWSKYTQNRKERNPRRVAIIKPLFSNVFSKSPSMVHIASYDEKCGAMAP